MSYLEKLNRFASNPVNMNMKRTKFNRSFTNTCTFTAGKLIPIMFDEIIPDDSVSIDVASVVRSITPAVPVMDNSYIDIYAFFVPNRIATVHEKDWQKVCGENVDGFWAPSSEATLINTGNTFTPFRSGYSVEPQSLADYMGLMPVGFVGDSGMTSADDLSRLPYNGYALIWNEFFRDENVQAPIAYKSFNNNSFIDEFWKQYGVLPTCKLHDYFTSALPGLQKGASVLLPMAGTAPVVTGSDHDLNPNNSAVHLIAGTGFNLSSKNLITNTNGGLDASSTTTTFTAQGADIRFRNLYTDLTAATAVSVNEMRQAFALQKLLEKDARGGTRYREMLMTHFGVSLPDHTAQVPEYLGGKRIPMNMLQVLQSAPTSGAPLGSTGAFSNTADNTHLCTKSFAEFGMLYVLMTIRTNQSYSQGINKFMRRNRRFDWYYPVFANLGEQAVHEWEIYAENQTDWDEVFGYQEAWAEYRYKPNQISGYCAAGSTDTVAKSWTYGNQFASKPVLNSSFIVQPRSQVDNTLVVSNSNYQYIGNFFFNYKIWRAMPYFSIPGLIDHH